jgi:RHS repeat-associated protein
MSWTTYTTVNGQILHQDKDGVGTHLIPDTLGNIIATIDEAGTVTSQTEYLPYGEVESQTGPSPTPFGFVGAWGYYNDSDSTTYIRARTYSPVMAAWVTSDPLWPEEEAFGYVTANPIVWFDPTGQNRTQNCTQERKLECAAKCAHRGGIRNCRQRNHPLPKRIVNCACKNKPAPKPINDNGRNIADGIGRADKALGLLNGIKDALDILHDFLPHGGCSRSPAEPREQFILCCTTVTKAGISAGSSAAGAALGAPVVGAIGGFIGGPAGLPIGAAIGALGGGILGGDLGNQLGDSVEPSIREFCGSLYDIPNPLDMRNWPGWDPHRGYGLPTDPRDWWHLNH